MSHARQTFTEQSISSYITMFYTRSKPFIEHCEKFCTENDSFRVVINILVNWNLSKRILTMIARYPCPNTSGNLSSHEDSNVKFEWVYFVEFFFISLTAKRGGINVFIALPWCFVCLCWVFVYYDSMFIVSIYSIIDTMHCIIDTMILFIVHYDTIYCIIDTMIL